MQFVLNYEEGGKNCVLHGNAGSEQFLSEMFNPDSYPARHPALAQALVQQGHEIACHGLQWIHYQNVPEDVERAHMQQAMQVLTQLTGTRPLG